MLTVPASARGVRLDKFLAQVVPNVSRSRVQQLVDAGHVTLDGRACKASHTLNSGETITVVIPQAGPVSVASEAIPLTVIYQDADVAVIDKPAGLTVHPSETQRSGTLVNALLHSLKDLSGIGGELRPGIVHRLDKNTSGLVIVAKHDVAHRRLAEQFADREVEKIYLAFALGITPESGDWTQTIGRHPTDRKRFSTKSKTGKTAHTRFVRRALYADVVSLMEIELLTGRTHQIRVHASDNGFPLVGDPTYRSDVAVKKIKNEAVRSLLAAFPRQALHAHKLTITLPSGKRKTFTSKLPPDLRQLEKALKAL